MAATDNDILLYRIITGLQFVEFNHSQYIVKPPSGTISYKANIIYNKTIEENMYSGWLMMQDTEMVLIDNGLWHPNNNTVLSNLDKKIDSLKIELYENFMISNKRRDLKKQISITNKHKQKLLDTKHSLDSTTLEHYAARIKNEFVIINTLYNSKNQRVLLNKKQTQSDFLNGIIAALSHLMPTIADIKRLARSELWKSYWGASLASKTPIFKGIVSDWTDEQRALVNLSRMYDSIRDHSESPSDDVINDDDALDGWMLVQKRKAEKEKTKKDKNKGEATEDERQKLKESLSNIVENIVEISEINNCESNNIIETLEMIRDKGFCEEVVFEVGVDCEIVKKVILLGAVSEKLLNTIITSYNNEENGVIINKIGSSLSKWKSDPSKGEVFTPSELVNQMLDKIPEEVWRNPKSLFLDPCMGKGTFLIEIVNRLVYIYKYSEEDAKSRVYGYDTRVKYINYLRRRGFINVQCKDFLNEEIKMKFDVILGNPPFQSGKGESGGRTALWRYFVKKGFSQLNENGILSFVTPQFPNSSKDIGGIFSDNQTVWVNTDIKKYFKEGSTFYTWAVKNTKKQIDTDFIFEGVKINVTSDTLPNIVSQESISIINKIKNKKSLNVLHSEGVNHNKLKKQTDTQSPFYTNFYQYKIRRTVDETFYSYTSILPTYYNDNKITFTKSGKPNFKYHDGETDPVGAIKHMSGIILCLNEEIANNMIWVFEESKLTKFYYLCLKSGGMNGFNFIHPVIDYTEIPSDEKIYSYYELSKEEIDYVESKIN